MSQSHNNSQSQRKKKSEKKKMVFPSELISDLKRKFVETSHNLGSGGKGEMDVE